MTAPGVQAAREIRAMNERIAARRAAAPRGRPTPVTPPRWAEGVLDLGTELVAIHKDTAEHYPLDMHADLSVEDHAVVVARRVLADGGTRQEAQRLLRAFGLEPLARYRLLRWLGEESA